MLLVYNCFRVYIWRNDYNKNEQQHLTPHELESYEQFLVSYDKTKTPKRFVFRLYRPYSTNSIKETELGRPIQWKPIKESPLKLTPLAPVDLKPYLDENSNYTAWKPYGREWLQKRLNVRGFILYYPISGLSNQIMTLETEVSCTGTLKMSATIKTFSSTPISI